MLPDSIRRSNYRRLGLIGNGQFGRVYCAIHRHTGQLVALKHLYRYSLPTRAFLRELRCLMSVEHPNIVTCQALEHSDDGRLLVLEYCAGGTLRSHMTQAILPSSDQLLCYIRDILQGLAHAHQQGIIHCDVKPENILLHYAQDRWQAKISDFGIAKLVQDRQQAGEASGYTGSPAYMAPERFDRYFSPAADIYAVGVILFELLVGHRPFSGTAQDLKQAHLETPVPRPEQLSGPLKPIILKALAKQPEHRYASAADMLAEIDSIPTLASQVFTSPCAYSHQAPQIYQRPPLRKLRRPINQLISTSSLGLVWAQGKQLHDYPEGSFSHSSHQTLDSPVQGLYISDKNIFVSTLQSLWQGSLHRRDLLTPIAHWKSPTLTVVDTRYGWVAAATPRYKRLTMGLLRQPRHMLASCYLPQAKDVEQILLVDAGHLALVSRSAGSGTQLHLWTRRGHDLGKFTLGITLRHITPTSRPYQWLGVDERNTNTMVILQLKPLRITCLEVEISPRWLLEMSWGYLLADRQGKLLLLDRDGYPAGSIHGPADITAMTPLTDHQLLLATWPESHPSDRQSQGQLHQLNLKQFDLDILF